jgi:benzoyl-CoA reductase/2-hydroxyglutaryl-CoA dehydratase subunit BcrC/BadD/HgdB
VEKHGGYVVAEDDWRGSRAAGERDVRSDGDPATAIFEKYFYDTVSPRILSDENDDWFRRQIESAQIHGVLFYVPLEDDVVGWDYPRQLAFLQTRGIPNLLIRNDEPTPELDTQLSTFIDRLHRE